MTVFATIILSSFFLEDDNFRVTGLFQDGSLNRSAGNQRRADGVVQSQNFVENYFLTFFTGDFLQLNNVAGGNFVLFSCLF